MLEAGRARGWDARVGLPGEGALFGSAQALGCETFRISCGPYSLGHKSAADMARFVRQLPAAAGQIRRRAREFRPDLLYLNGPRVLPAAALAGLGIPALFHSHSYVPPGMTREMAGRALRRLGANVVACCGFVGQPWERFVARDRVSVIFNGVAGPDEPVFHWNPGAPKIGCIGRISPEKGQLEFIEAARRIHTALPQSRFAIYGAPLFSNEAARYADRVRAAAGSLPVEFAGWTVDVYQVLSGLDLLLVPSGRQEATTRVILEAFAAGVPAIAFRAGGIPEVVEDGRTGFLVDSAREMAECALTLLSGDPARMCAVSQAARESWCARFTLEHYQQQLLAALEAAARSSDLPARREADRRK